MKNKPKYNGSFIGKVQEIPCPICKALNPVSRVNARMRCKECGTQLLSVRIRKNIRRRKK